MDHIMWNQKDKLMMAELVSIIIATFNSQKILTCTLDAIVNQDYPRDLLEILIIDGESTDKTREIARQYGCHILDNPKTEPINAKLIGMQNASGNYILFLDHDEVLENRNSIKNKVAAMKANPECHVVLGSGYKRPEGYPKINQYISEYGDPFSLFLYNFSKYDKCFERILVNNYVVSKDNKDYMVVDFKDMKKQPIIELCCLGTMIDKDYFGRMSGAFYEGKVMTHLFYIMLQQGDTKVICMKKDALLHYSADSIKAYIPKLKWRVCNNVHFEQMGESGLSGRLKYQRTLRYKMILFVPYSLFIIPAFMHGFILAMARKNCIYLLHPVFSLYVLIQIFFQYGLKILGIKPRMKSYDGKKNIDGQFIDPEDVE